MSEPLTIALAKGRLLEGALALLARVGIRPRPDADPARRLLLETEDPALRLFVARSMDIPAYIEHGAADLGIVGRDILLERRQNDFFDPLDLGIGRCRLVLAAPRGQAVHDLENLRVATKYVRTARRYFAGGGRQVELIRLGGALELAPLLGIADCIVDLVATGRTLKANDLVPVDTVAEISARLVVNKASMRFKHEALSRLIGRLREAAAGDGGRQGAEAT